MAVTTGPGSIPVPPTGKTPAPNPLLQAVAPKRSVVYYTPNGWNTLLDATKANLSPNTNYYFSVNGPAADQTGVRNASAYNLITSLGQNAHPMAEFNLSHWKSKPGSWFRKGVEFRREMEAQGLGDAMWSINEAGSGMRAKSEAARNHLVNLVKGLYQGGHGMDHAQGVVFQQGPGYQQGLKHFLGDKKFWGEMQRAVKFYMPETYISPSRFLHENPQQQREYLLKALANKKLAGPVMSAYWGAQGNYGNTQVPLGNMEQFVNEQLQRLGKRNVYGLAWNEHPQGKSAAELQVLANQIAAAAAGKRR